MTKQKFTLIITTDGMDDASDMEHIKRELKRFMPAIVMPFVNATEPAWVTWDGPVKPPKEVKTCAKPKKRR